MKVLGWFCLVSFSSVLVFYIHGNEIDIVFLGWLDSCQLSYLDMRPQLRASNVRGLNLTFLYNQKKEDKLYGGKSIPPILPFCTTQQNYRTKAEPDIQTKPNPTKSMIVGEGKECKNPGQESKSALLRTIKDWKKRKVR